MARLNNSEKELVKAFLKEMEQGTVSMRESLKDLRDLYRSEYPEADFEKVVDELIERMEEVFDSQTVQWTKAVSILSEAKSMYPYSFNFSDSRDMERKMT
jgi:ribosome recycling factor